MKRAPCLAFAFTALALVAAPPRPQGHWETR